MKQTNKISYGKLSKGIKKYNKSMIGLEYENSNAYCSFYTNPIYSTHRDNNGISYNGQGCGSNRNIVRIPSLKRSNKTWKNFYTMFPNYYDILKQYIEKYKPTTNYIQIKLPASKYITGYYYDYNILDYIEKNQGDKRFVGMTYSDVKLKIV